MLKEKAIAHFDGKPSRLAKALDVSPASVSGWGVVIPEKQAFRLERITGGELKYDYTLYMSKHKQTA